MFHLAAIASVPVCAAEPVRAHRTNAVATSQLFAAAARANIAVVYASSAAVYGDNQALPLSETAAPAPLSDYGQHKLANERDAQAAYAAHGLRSVGLRFFNVYGPRQDPSSPYSGVISKFMQQAAAGAPLVIFGDGQQTRDFIYVADIVELLVTAARHAHGCELFNGCTGTQTDLVALAATICSVTQSTSALRHESARAGDIRHSLGSPLKAAEIMDFTAKTSLTEGLRQLYASEAAHAA